MSDVAGRGRGPERRARPPAARARRWLHSSAFKNNNIVFRCLLVDGGYMPSMSKEPIDCTKKRLEYISRGREAGAVESTDNEEERLERAWR